MQWDQLDRIATQIRGMVSGVVLKTEVEVIKARYHGEPSVLLVSVWTNARGQGKNLRQLVTSLKPKDWKRTRIRTKTEKDQFLWKATVRVEYKPQTGKPLAVRLAEQGRPGQEKDPSYVR